MAIDTYTPRSRRALLTAGIAGAAAFATFSTVRPAAAGWLLHEGDPELTTIDG